MEPLPTIEFSRPTRAEIRLGALRRNFERARALAGPGVKVMAVVKANAYGHGLCRVAKELRDAGADYLGVAMLEEGVALRRAGFGLPILILGPTSAARIAPAIEYGLEFAVHSPEIAEAAAAAASAAGAKARVHLKIDTGMERIGAHWYSAEPFLDRVLDLPALEVAGLFTHFATADEDAGFAREQISRFLGVREILAARDRVPPILHMANSAGLVGYPEARFDMVRPGILLYGYEPFAGKRVGLEPVMRLMSVVAYAKTVRAGSGVSYGRTWSAPAETRIATIPAGYGDGYARSLSNKGEVSIRGRRYPVVGRVCMDQFMVDLGSDLGIREGDDVILFGERDGERMPAEFLLERMGTIAYELTCNISARVPRVYVED